MTQQLSMCLVIVKQVYYALSAGDHAHERGLLVNDASNISRRTGVRYLAILHNPKSASPATGRMRDVHFSCSWARTERSQLRQRLDQGVAPLQQCCICDQPDPQSANCFRRIWQSFSCRLYEALWNRWISKILAELTIWKGKIQTL